MKINLLFHLAKNDNIHTQHSILSITVNAHI